jgi:uncharacterized protein CbrC (UPF0167 family)
MTTTHKGLDASFLIAAIGVARENHDGDTRGLSATRRVYSGPGQREWIVRFDNDAGAFLTVISDSDVTDMTDAEIKDVILDCWDSDWDDIHDYPAVGDFTVGSSDFTQRNKSE